MILENFSLKGKVAIVTGASRGLGEGMALGLAEAGADVAVVSSTDKVQKTVEKIRAMGRKSIGITADLGTIEPIGEIVRKTVAELGGLDILVNCAGTIRRAPAIEFSEKDWDDVLNLNLKTVFFLSQAAAKEMAKKGKGKIINIASMLSFQGGIIVPSYTAAKSGIAGITKAMANEWAPLGINVNAIAPGYMATELTSALQKDPARSDAILTRIPSGRWGTPDDLKGAAVFLASDAADYVQAQVLAVDGGWLSR